MEYYPLQIGNNWQYKSTAMAWGEVGPFPYYSVTVRGDTTLSNGKTYRILECSKYREIHPHFQRIDSTTYEIFAFDTSEGGNEFKIDSLLAQPGLLSIFRGCRIHSIKLTIMSRIDTAVFWGNSLPCRYYSTFAGLNGLRSITYTLTKGLGITSLTDGVYDDPAATMHGFEDQLVYAKIKGKEYGTLVSIRQISDMPKQFVLSQNYPNPFNSSTIIRYELPKKSEVDLRIYDVIGREIAILVHEKQSAGIRSVKLDAADLSSGMYFYRLVAEDFVLTKRMIVLK